MLQTIHQFDLTHNQEKDLVKAFSVIVKTDGSFAALLMGLESPDLSVYNTCQCSGQPRRRGDEAGGGEDR